MLLRLVLIVSICSGTLYAQEPKKETRDLEIIIPSKRYPLTINSSQYLLAYESSKDLWKRNSSIKRILIICHGYNYNPVYYFENTLKILQQDRKHEKTTLLIAPCLMEEKYVIVPPKDFVYWESYPFWGTSNAIYFDQKKRVSAFELVDKLLEKIVSSAYFPNIKTVIVAGHSAGGQFTNRYATSERFSTSSLITDKKIECRFLVMGPSSYVYFTPERVKLNSLSDFAVPENPVDNYNAWGYGLDNLYSVHRRNKMTAESITKHYSGQRIFYLIGGEDNDEDDPVLSTKPAAILQGANRFERMNIYRNYIRHVFGEEIYKHQFFRYMEDVGHSGKKLLDSKPAKKFIFMPNRKP